ncbi:hypothetical protein K443DRAFT_77171, partial [Laccaria amethystina LaAM-08-1]
PKKEVDTDRLQNITDRLKKSDIDYKTTNFSNRLQKTTIVHFFVIKVCSVCFWRLQKFVVHFFNI